MTTIRSDALVADAGPRLGDTRTDLTADHLALIPKGAQRAIAAGPAGNTYPRRARRAELGELRSLGDEPVDRE